VDERGKYVIEKLERQWGEDYLSIWYEGYRQKGGEVFQEA